MAPGTSPGGSSSMASAMSVTSRMVSALSSSRVSSTQSVKLELCEAGFGTDERLKGLARALRVVVREAAMQLPDKSEAFVLQMSVEQRPRGHGARETRSIGSQTTAAPRHSGTSPRASLAEGGHERIRTLIAEDVIKVIDLTPVISTRFGNWLLDRGYFNVVVSLTALLFVFLFFSGTVLIPTGGMANNDQGSFPMELEFKSVTHSVLELIVWWFGMFVLLHRAPRSLLVFSFFSFDPLAMMSNGLVATALPSMNRLDLGLRAGVLATEDVVGQLIRSILVYIPLHLVFANFDVFLFSRPYKILWVLVGLVGYIGYYWQKRYVTREWADTSETCRWLYCGSLRHISLTVAFNVTFFLLKTMRAYLLGRDTAALHARMKWADASPPPMPLGLDRCFGCLRVRDPLDADKEEVHSMTLLQSGPSYDCCEVREIAVQTEPPPSFDGLQLDGDDCAEPLRLSLGGDLAPDVAMVGFTRVHELWKGIRPLRSGGKDFSQSALFVSEGNATPEIELIWDCDFMEDPDLDSVRGALCAVIADCTQQTRLLDELVVLRIAAARRPRAHIHLPIRSQHAQTEQPTELRVSAAMQAAAAGLVELKKARQQRFCAFVAQDGVKVVSFKPMLDWCFVRWLVKKRLFNFVVVMNLLVVVVLFFTTRVSVDTGLMALTDGDDVPLVLHFKPLHVMLVEMLGFWLFMVLLLHQTAPGILTQTMFTFDALAMSANGCLFAFVLGANRIYVGAAAGVLTLEYAIAEVINGLCVHCPIFILIGNCDAIQLPHTAKVMLLGMASVSYCMNYLQTRFSMVEWPKEQLCMWIHCAHSRSIALILAFNIWIFTSKLFVTVLFGSDFATLDAPYRRSTMPRATAAGLLKRCRVCRPRGCSARDLPWAGAAADAAHCDGGIQTETATFDDCEISGRSTTSRCVTWSESPSQATGTSNLCQEFPGLEPLEAAGELASRGVEPPEAAKELSALEGSLERAEV